MPFQALQVQLFPERFQYGLVIDEDRTQQRIAELSGGITALESTRSVLLTCLETMEFSILSLCATQVTQLKSYQWQFNTSYKFEARTRLPLKEAIEQYRQHLDIIASNPPSTLPEELPRLKDTFNYFNDIFSLGFSRGFACSDFGHCC
jgi:hypothetical protein